ncbi:MAG: efflux transporter outer membrane subunit [bacterium]|nr:MAG: efflux transporter outer membrane subunit [bacterium]
MHRNPVKSRRSRLALFAVLVLALAGCTVGQEYRRPELSVPKTYREGAPWKEAEPSDTLPKGRWWSMFSDAGLDDLQDRARKANQDLQAALARIEQARSALQAVGSGIYPRLDLNPSAERKRTAEDLSSTGSGLTSTTLRTPLDLSYEVDLWGRVRRSVEAARTEFEASQADFENILLALQADVARSYFSLRTLDAEIDLLGRTVDLRRKNLELVQSLFRNGQVSRLDLARAETELANTTADLAALRRLRASTEHALAVLAGEPASGFRVPAMPLDLDAQPPAVYPGIPSSLLERRPDIAAAERRLMAANARIGVAEAAFFPSIRLTGSAGYASDELSSLFSWDNRTWSLGPFLSLPVFDGGRNRSGLNLARARWEEAVARYRKQVLVAFAEVEDALSDLRNLDVQSQAQRQAMTSARQASELSGKRYRAGLVSYLEVVVSERTALASELLAVRVLGLRLQASVTLIKALGGGWEDASGAGNQSIRD